MRRGLSGRGDLVADVFGALERTEVVGSSHGMTQEQRKKDQEGHGYLNPISIGIEELEGRSGRLLSPGPDRRFDGDGGA